MRRTDLLSQYIAYHKPGWVVYLPVVQTVGICKHQLARLMDIASKGQVQLAILVRRNFLENIMEVVHFHDEHNVEIMTSVDQLARILEKEQGS